MDFFDPTKLPDDVKAIRDMAIEAHGNQRYGDQPYSVHLDEVAAIVYPHGWDYVKLAYCHDLLEDVPGTDAERHYWEQKILALTDDSFLSDTQLLTDEPGKNRKERKAKTYAKMRQAGPDLIRALVVKMADRLANARNSERTNPGLLKMYQKEHSAFRASVYRPGVANELKQDLDRILGDCTPELGS